MAQTCRLIAMTKMTVDAGLMSAGLAVCGPEHVVCDQLLLGLGLVCPERPLPLVGVHVQTVIHLQIGLPFLQG